MDMRVLLRRQNLSQLAYTLGDILNFIKNHATSLAYSHSGGDGDGEDDD